MKKSNIWKLSGVLALLVACCLTGCRKTAPEPDTSTDAVELTEPATTQDTAEDTDTQPEETRPDAYPDKLSDAAFSKTEFNAHGFDDGEFSFVSVPDGQDSVLSVEIVELGDDHSLNRVLRLTDKADTGTQQIDIAVDKLLSPDQLETVYSIGFTLYVVTRQATEREQSALLGTVTAETQCADGTTYAFAPAVFSDDGTGVLTFAEADEGKRWGGSPATAQLRITRSDFPENSDIYLDNILFYDQEGNSIPLSPSYQTQG